jgi:hypothetical protein
MPSTANPSTAGPGDAARALGTLAALALAPAVGLGVARFAYALALPDMSADLGWDYAEAGRMTAANALGHLAGAALAARAVAAAGAFPTTAAGALA